MKNEVIMVREHRMGFDHACRAAGGKIIEVGTADELKRAINQNTAMLFWVNIYEPKGKISAGTFASSAGGDAMMRATYPLPASELRAIAVTEEPAGGMPQPTGAMVLAGQAH